MSDHLKGKIWLHYVSYAPISRLHQTHRESMEDDMHFMKKKHIRW